MGNEYIMGDFCCAYFHQLMSCCCSAALRAPVRKRPSIRKKIAPSENPVVGRMAQFLARGNRKAAAAMLSEALQVKKHSWDRCLTKMPQLPGDQRTKSLALYVKACSTSEKKLTTANRVVLDAHHERVLGASVFGAVVRGWCQLGELGKACDLSTWMSQHGFEGASGVAFSEVALTQVV